tara:strand:- start:2577 stop:3302 length:726 start_codon:yes stop_codon:yes gene_type:complete
MFSKKSWIAVIGVLNFVFFFAGEVISQPQLLFDPESVVASDGLQQVDPFIMETAYVRPDIDLDKYTSILIMPTITSFRDVPKRYNPKNDLAITSFPVSEVNKERLNRFFGESFHEFASQLKPYEVTGTVGRNVLLVQGLLVDIVSGIPPTRTGSNTTFIKQPWEVTLMVELRDSMSNRLLARSAEKQLIDGVYDVTELPGITKWATEEWSAVLLQRLRSLVDIGGGRWSQCELQENNCSLN